VDLSHRKNLPTHNWGEHTKDLGYERYSVVLGVTSAFRKITRECFREEFSGHFEALFVSIDNTDPG
jgi:hypothetical protein